MKIQYLIPVLLIATLVIGSVTAMNLESVKATNKKVLAVTSRMNAVSAEELKEKIPEQSVVEKEVEAIQIPRRFILWTHDGENVMWGKYGNGYLTGKDNSGKYTWGIYGNGVFAGFYDGEFFWGHYRKGLWKAEGLFGLKSAHGGYMTFPNMYPITTEDLDG